MTKKRRWTIEEERVLIDQITRNANNLTTAFKKTARLTGRTVRACEARWYTVISKRDSISVCFATIGHKTVNINRKNVASGTSDNTEKTTATWWRKVLFLLKRR